MDSYALLGQHRKPYIMIGAFLNFTGYLVIGTISNMPLSMLMLNLFIASLGAALCSAASDALLLEIMDHESRSVENTEGITTEVARSNRNYVATTQITSYFGAKAAGSLMVSYASGALLAVWSKSTIFTCTAFFPLIIAVIAYRVQEDTGSTSQEPVVAVMREKLQLGCRTVYRTALFYPVLFNLIFVLMPDYDEALMFYIINKLHFSSTFLGTLKLTYGVASIVGLLIYQFFLLNVSLKRILISTTILVFPFYITPILMVNRYNVAWGIPDDFFLVGGGFMTEAIAEIQLLPIIMLASKECPRKHEATVLSIVTSMRTIGYMISKAFGSSLMAALAISKYNYAGMSTLIITCCTLSLLPLCLSGKLPNTSVEKGPRSPLRGTGPTHITIVP